MISNYVGDTMVIFSLIFGLLFGLICVMYLIYDRGKTDGPAEGEKK